MDLGASPSDESSVSIEVLDEPDGSYLAPDALQGILRQVDSQARVEWDSPAGALRIFVSGRQMQAVLKNAIVDIDGTTRRVDSPLRMKSSGVIIPMSTVRVMLAELNMELDLADAGPGSGTFSQSGTMTMRTSDEAASGSETSRWSSSSAEARTQALPELVLPDSFAGEIGLTWSQLGDERHNKAPQKILVTFDRELEPLATALRDYLRRYTTIEASLMAISGPRNDPRLVAQVVGQYPDLHVDLMLSPTSSVEGTGSGRTGWGLEVWTVHDALWPGDRMGQDGESKSARLPYHLHQYHNLALGSLVRMELYSAFPGRSVMLQLSPAYLLRRMNAPCIALLIPPAMLQDRTSISDGVARATASGIAHYVRGMQAVTGTR